MYEIEWGWGEWEECYWGDRIVVRLGVWNGVLWVYLCKICIAEVF